MEELFSGTSEWPILGLDKFLVDPDHELHMKDVKTLELKVANKKSDKPHKRGKLGTAWERMHKTAYEKLGVPYTPPNQRDTDFEGNIHYEILPIREKDVILYWNLAEPLDKSGDLLEQELSTSARVNSWKASFLTHRPRLWSYPRDGNWIVFRETIFLGVTSPIND